MFYHALTGNGVTEDLEPVLLWENSSPTTAFAAQTISLNLTDYTGVIIEFNKSDLQQTIAGRLYCKKTDNYGGYTGVGYVALAGSQVSTSARCIIKVDNNGVEFGNSATNNLGDHQTILIPIRIYGVKEYIVEASEWELGTFTSSATGAVKVTLGYKPKKLLIIYAQSAGLQSSAAATIAVYDEKVSRESYQFITSTSETTLTLPNTTDERLASIDDDGFTFNKSSVSGIVDRYVAIK